MPPQRQQTYASLIKNKAIQYGFAGCGMSKAVFLEAEAPRLEAWLKKNHNAGMAYMSRNFDKRLNPVLLAEGTKTVISLVYNYHNNHSQNCDSFYKVAAYARLYDYHFFLKIKMKALIDDLRLSIGHFEAACFVDSAPVLERAWAVRAGLGFIGKNTQLYLPRAGSQFFICQILTDLETTCDAPLTDDYCGKCRRCVEACPNKAILPDKTIDARKCISYLTIEHKGALPAGLLKNGENSIFGCDICLDVCPLNYKHKCHHDVGNYVNNPMLSLQKEQWESLTKTDFKEIFKNSPLWRSGLGKIKENIDLLNLK